MNRRDFVRAFAGSALTALGIGAVAALPRVRRDRWGNRYDDHGGLLVPEKCRLQILQGCRENAAAIKAAPVYVKVREIRHVSGTIVTTGPPVLRKPCGSIAEFVQAVKEAQGASDA